MAGGRGGKDDRKQNTWAPLARPRPFLKQASGQIFEDDGNGFPSISDIFFMKETEQSETLKKQWQRSNKQPDIRNNLLTCLK
jgi:hypothetical protein